MTWFLRFEAAHSTDRAFGALQSGTVATTIGTMLTNGTGSALTQLTISFTGEQWRPGKLGREDRLDFAFSTNTTDLTTGTWTANANLNFITPTTAGSVGAIDGNAVANSTDISYTLSGLNIASGSNFWICWSDLEASGFDDGLAIDNFSIIAPSIAGAATPNRRGMVLPVAQFLAMLLLRSWTA